MKISMFITPLILVILGVILRLGKASFLIAGYNTSSKQEKEKYDEKALCKFTGNLLFVIAAILFLPPIVMALNLTYTNSIVIVSTILIIFVTIVAVIYANTGNRFKK